MNYNKNRECHAAKIGKNHSGQNILLNHDAAKNLLKTTILCVIIIATLLCASLAKSESSQNSSSDNQTSELTTHHTTNNDDLRPQSYDNLLFSITPQNATTRTPIIVNIPGVRALQYDEFIVEAQTPTQRLRMMDDGGSLNLPISFTPSEPGEYKFFIISRAQRRIIAESTITIQDDERIDAEQIENNTNTTISYNNTKTSDAIIDAGTGTNNPGAKIADEGNKTYNNSNDSNSNIDETYDNKDPEKKWYGKGILIKGQDALRPRSVHVRQKNTYKNKGVKTPQGTDKEQYFDGRNISELDRLNGTYDIELDSPIPGVTKLTLYNATINGYATLGIENIGPPNIETISVTAAFAIDPEQVNMSSGTITRTASGTNLYKCKEWNFENQICSGNWTYAQPITPGSEYNITLESSDPGFAEGIIATGYPMINDISAPFVSASVPSPIETTNASWGIVVFNPTNSSIKVTNLSLSATSSGAAAAIFSTVAGINPASGWSRPATSKIVWSGNITIQPNDAEQFIANISGPNTAIVNVIIEVNATTNTTNLSTSGYITYSGRNTNLQYPSVYFPNATNKPSYVIRNITGGTQREYTIRVDNLAGAAPIPNGTSLVMYIPPGWRDVSIDPENNQNGWITGTVKGDEGSGWILMPQLVANISAGGYIELNYTATAPERDGTVLYHTYSLLLGPGATTTTSISTTFVPAFQVVNSSVNLLDANDDRYSITSTQGGTDTLDQYLSVPAPIGRTAENVWGLVVVNPNDTAINVTRIDWTSTIPLFNTTSSTTPGSWAVISSNNIRWTGTTTIAPHDTAEFLMNVKALGTTNNVTTITATTVTSAGTIVTDNFVTYMRNGNIQYPSLYGLNSQGLPTLTYDNLTAKKPVNITIRVNNTGGGSTIPTYTGLEIYIPTGWTNISASAQTGWQITNVRSDPKGGGIIRAVTYSTTIASGGSRDFIFTATPPDAGTNSTYRIDAWLFGETGVLATQMIQSTSQLAMNVVPSQYGINLTRDSITIGNATNLTSITIHDIVKAKTSAEFNFSILNTATGNFETINNNILGTSDEDWNITIPLNATSDPKKYVNTTSGSEDYGKITVRWYAKSNNATALYEDYLYYNATFDTLMPKVTLLTQNNSNSSTGNITLLFNFSDDYGLRNCTLYINGSANITMNITISDPVKSSDSSFNLSFVSDGDYKWSVLCNDFIGNKNSSQNNTFIIDTKSPANFTLQSPSNNTYSQNLQPNLSWQQANDLHFARYEITISENNDLSNPIAKYNTTSQSNNSKVIDALEPNAEFYWSASAFDTFGNSVNSTNIFKYTTDTIPPQVTLQSPDDHSYILSSQADFSYIPSDTNLDNCTLYGNFSGSWQNAYTQISPINADTNDISISFPDGTYKWNIACYDKAGSLNYAVQNRTILIDTTPPQIKIISPQNNTYDNDTNNFAFVFNVTDSMSDIDYCSLSIDNDIAVTSHAITEGISHNFSGFVENGNHNWSITCFDNNGFSSTTPNYYLLVNVSTEHDPPIITLITPYTDRHFSYNNLTFNYTVDDASGIDNCSLYIDDVANQTTSDMINHQSSTFEVYNISEGLHTWHISCYDNLTFEQGLSIKKNFTIDLVDPQVTLIFPQNNSYSSQTITTFNYTTSENNIDNCSLWINSTGVFDEVVTDKSSTNGSKNISAILDDGAYIWNVLCADKSGRMSFGETNFTLKKDAFPPTIINDVTYPDSFITYDPNISYQFNISIREAFLDTIILESNLSGTTQNQTVYDSRSNTSQSPDGTYYYLTYGLAPGDYNYQWFVNDTSGRESTSDIDIYTVQVAQGIVNLTLNGAAMNITANDSAQINISAFTISPISGYISVYLDGTLAMNGSTALFNSTVFENPGLYNITATYDGNSNYTGDSKTLFVAIRDTAPPDILLITPVNSSTSGTRDVSFQYNASDYSNISSCSIYINNTKNMTDSNVQSNSISLFIISLQDGNYSWKINCTDNANNSAQSETRLMKVQKSDTIVSKVTANKTSYESGEQAAITANTTDIFKSPLDANDQIDIIYGNSTTPWWNSSWEKRVPILLTNKRSQALTNTIVDINISGLAGNISNCEELRIIKTNSSNSALIETPRSIINGDDNTSCSVEFLADVSAGAKNESIYYAYYNNSGASVPSYSITTNNVQRNDTTGTGTTLTGSLGKSINTSKAFVLFTANTASNSPNANEYTADLSSSQATFSRYSGGTASTISWQVVESQDINVQRGINNFATSDIALNISINNVNQSKAFILVYGRANSATAGNNSYGYFRARFVNDTTIELKRARSGIAATASWQVIEWDGALVKTGNLSFTNTNGSANFAKINTSNSMLFFSYDLNMSPGIGANYISGGIQNSTQAIFTRTYSVGAVELSWFIVEFGTYVTIQNGLRSFTTNTTSSINAVIPEKSFHWQSWTSAGTTSTTYQNAMVKASLANSTTLKFDKQSTTQTNIVNWTIVQMTFNETNNSIGKTEELVLTAQNSSGASGILFLTIDTAQFNPGNYSCILTSTKQNFTTSVNSTVFEIRSDTIKPLITIISPQNNSWQNSSVTFTYTPSDTNLNNCSLWTNSSGTFRQDTSNTAPINKANNTIQFNMDDGVVLWNIRCDDTYGNYNFSQQNRTIRVDSTPPKITLLSPQNNSNITGQNTFSWRPDDAQSSNITCSLYLNDALNKSNISAFSGNVTMQNLTISDGGSTSWKINCSDMNGNANTSATLSFYNLVAPQYVNVSSNSSGVTLVWSAVSGIDSYAIYITNNYDAGWPATPNITTSSTTYTDSQATGSQQRYYKVAAVKNNLESAQVQMLGKYDIKLANGLNLISFPLRSSTVALNNGSNNGFSFMTSVPCVKSLWRYNTTSYQRTDWNGSAFIPATGSGSFTTIEMNKSYWLETNVTCNLSFSGTVPTGNDTRSLKQGYNLLSWNSVKNITLPTNYEPVLFNVRPNNSIQSINRYNPTTGLFEITVHYVDGNTSWGWYPSFNNPDFTTMEPSRGYFFSASTTTNWTFDPKT